MDDEAREAATRANAERVQRERTERLENLKSFGRALVAHLSIDVRRHVIADLEAFVNERNLPPGLEESEANEVVASRVFEVRSQFEAEEARKVREAAERVRIESLIEGGLRTVMILTLNWDPRDAEEARAEVARKLKRWVDSSSNEHTVRSCVEGILEQWEEVDEPSEDKRADGGAERMGRSEIDGEEDSDDWEDDSDDDDEFEDDEEELW
jgi:hypothetical protein